MASSQLDASCVRSILDHIPADMSLRETLDAIRISEYALPHARAITAEIKSMPFDPVLFAEMMRRDDSTIPIALHWDSIDALRTDSAHGSTRAAYLFAKKYVGESSIGRPFAVWHYAWHLAEIAIECGHIEQLRCILRWDMAVNGSSHRAREAYNSRCMWLIPRCISREEIDAVIGDGHSDQHIIISAAECERALRRGEDPSPHIIAMSVLLELMEHQDWMTSPAKRGYTGSFSAMPFAIAALAHLNAEGYECDALISRMRELKTKCSCMR